MAYITQAQLEERFAGLQWWTDDAAGGTTDATVVAEAIALAGGEIDAAASQYYATPLDTSNATTAVILRDKAGAIAGYKLASRVPPVSQDLRDAYEDVLKWLVQLASGKVALPGQTAIDPARPSGQPVIAGESIILTRTEMDGL